MIFDSISDVLPGLLPASYRGISFHVPDTSTQVGRRVAEHLFPGIDQAAYDDFGLATQTVRVEGLIVSDSYIAQCTGSEGRVRDTGTGYAYSSMAWPDAGHHGRDGRDFLRRARAARRPLQRHLQAL
ncbi:hypothetical protein DEA98_00015 [Brucella pseudogrignonensis]|nr:hypothetical protein [Brucella pseudogrignonensis]